MAPSPNRISAFWVSLVSVTGLYLFFLLAMLAATASYSTPGDLWKTLNSPEIRTVRGVGYLLADGREDGA